MTELQTVVQLVDPPSETPSEGNEIVQQSNTTVEQPAHTPMSEIEIEQIVHLELISNFLETLPQEVVISQLESEVVEVQSGTHLFTHNNPLPNHQVGITYLS